MKYFLLEENIISVLEDFKLTCSPNIWAIGSWFLPQEFDTASTDHMEQVLSHRTVCFDSPKWPIQVTLAVQELSNVSMSTLCKEHAEANLHPRSEPRFFQKSDIEHNFLDFCRPWLRSILRSWQHDACECPTQDQWEIIAASCSQTLFFDLWLVIEIVQIHFTAVHISKLRSTKIPVEIAITCFWYFVLGKKKNPYLELHSLRHATYDKGDPHLFPRFFGFAVKHMTPETSHNELNDNSLQRVKINDKHHCCNLSLIFLSFTPLEWCLELICKQVLSSREKIIVQNQI